MAKNNKNNNNKKNSFFEKYSKNKNMAKQSKSISVYKKIAISFIVLTLVLVAVVVYFSIVSVKITIIPNRERIATNFIAQVLNEGSEAEKQELSIVGIVEILPLELSDTFFATGKDVEDTKVLGTVTIYNNYTNDQPLVKSTRLLSPNGKLFRIDERADVPAGGKVENVPIYADKSSEDMVIDPTKFTIPGLWEGLQDKIYAESFTPTKYEEIGDSFIIASDIEQAKNTLKDRLKEEAQKEVGTRKYKGYDRGLYRVDDNSITFSTGAKVDQKVEEFNMSVEASVAIVAFNLDDLGMLAEKKIQEILPDDKEIEDFNNDNMVVNLDRSDIELGTADIKTEAIAQMVIKEGTEIINPEKLAGLTREQLTDYLSNLREVASAEVKFTPSWIKKVPSLVDRIKVEVQK